MTTTLTFDPKTIALWKESGIFAVRVGFVQSGCEGNRLSVEPTSESEDIQSLESRPTKDGITITATKEDWEKIEGARIVGVGEKWIFTSEKVKRRCGCGSSFSFEDIDRMVRDFPVSEGVTLLHSGNRDTKKSATQTIIDLGDKTAQETIITVPPGQSLQYRGFFGSGSKVQVRFLVEEGAKLDARIFTSSEESHVQADIQSYIVGSRAQANIIYRAFAFYEADMRIDTHINITENISGVRAGIEGKNVFFADIARIAGIPRVSAASEDIQAGHSLSFEKISDTDTFYLESRGLSYRQARKMLAESHIRTIFSDIDSNIAEYLVQCAMQTLS